MRAGNGATTAIFWVWCSQADREIPVVYDFVSAVVVTVLPEDFDKRPTQRPRRRPAEFRQFDETETAEEASELEPIALVAEAAPNNVLAEALREALSK